MADARLTHPTRETLPLRQRQNQDDTRQVVLDIANPPGERDKPAQINTRTIAREIPIGGRVTGNRLSTQLGEPNHRQALADYLDTLESHVDEYQASGYTFEDDLLNNSVNVMLTSVEWRMTPGQPTDIQYDATLTVGQGTYEEDSIRRENPTPRDDFEAMLRLDGIELPNMRNYEVAKEIETEVKPVFNRNSAGDNDVIPQAGPQRTLTYEGTRTGPMAEIRVFDSTLESLLATKENVELETRFPGYTVEGFVTDYTSVQREQFGTNQIDYRIEFVEGIRS